MRSIFQPAAPDATAPVRIVLLPGAYHSAQDLVHAGFVDSVRRRRLAIDLTLVDLELHHLGERGVLRQLRNDIVMPARALGGTAVWLAGISLGGFIALDYAACHPGELDGLCLLAPYLGNRMLLAEIARAPGLAAWQPGKLAETDEERRIWRFIKTYSAQSMPVYLGYGREDRFAQAHELMARALPDAAVKVVPGGHGWLAWSDLWENFLDITFT
jgi:pimeloyl-ACP methyl ester carboxylesterase